MDISTEKEPEGKDPSAPGVVIEDMPFAKKVVIYGNYSAYRVVM